MVRAKIWDNCGSRGENRVSQRLDWCEFGKSFSSHSQDFWCLLQWRHLTDHWGQGHSRDVLSESFVKRLAAPLQELANYLWSLSRVKKPHGNRLKRRRESLMIVSPLIKFVFRFYSTEHLRKFGNLAALYRSSHVQYRQTDTVWKHSLTIRTYGLTNWDGLKKQPHDPNGLTDRKDNFGPYTVRKLHLIMGNWMCYLSDEWTVWRSVRFVQIVKALFGPYTVREMHLI